MASGKLYLRPSSDVYVEHFGQKAGETYLPDQMAGEAYLLISEEESDGESTCITCSINQPSTTSKFVLENKSNFPSKGFVITSVELCASSVPLGYSVGSLNYFTLEIAGVQTAVRESLTNGIDTSISILDAEAVGVINEYLIKNKKMPQICVSVRSKTYIYNHNNGKSEEHESGISQLYVVLTYEEVGLNIYKKVNGEIKSAAASYRKVEGSWLEISEATCKDVLKNKIIVEGKK